MSGLKSSKKVNAPKNGDEAGLAKPESIPGICDEMRIISFILTKSKTISHIFYLFHISCISSISLIKTLIIDSIINSSVRLPRKHALVHQQPMP